MPETATTAKEARRLAFTIAPGVLLAGIAGGIAFPVLPIVGMRAGLPLWLIGTILAANRFARLIVSPFVGTLTDRVGGRRTLIAGMSLQVVVMLLYLLGVLRGRPGTYFLVARLIHGPASACVFVAAQTLALHAGGRSHGGAASSVVRAAMSAGMPIGLAVGGLLSALWGVPAMFAAAAVAVVLAALVAWRTVPDLRAKAQGHKASLGSPWRALLDRRLAAVGALNFATFFSAQGIVMTTIALLMNRRGIQIAGLGDEGTAGLAMAWMVLISIGTMAVAGSLGDRRRSHALIAGSGICLSVPGLIMVGLGSSGFSLAAGLGLVGLGMGGLGPSVLALLSVVVEPEARGRASGAMQLCADIGGTLGPIVGTTLVAYGDGLPYLVGAAATALALPAAVWLSRFEKALPAREPEAGIGATVD